MRVIRAVCCGHCQSRDMGPTTTRAPGARAGCVQLCSSNAGEGHYATSTSGPYVSSEACEVQVGS